MDTRSLVAVVAIGFALAGCRQGQQESESQQSGATSLKGPIPECMELLSPARKPYRIEANRQCLEATSLDQRLKSSGCLARQEVGRCLATEAARANNFGVDEIKAEDQAARALAR